MSAAFIMAGGGTGGHVIPSLAVARELRTRGHSPLFVGTERGLESKLVPPENFPIEFIEIGGLNRVGLKRALETLADLPLSLWQASRILDRTKPAAVFSMGGYVAGPVLLAALWKRIPVVVMEPNAIPGLTHRKLARFVARALVNFPETARWFPKDRTEVTGVPVREEFFKIRKKHRGAELTVLITGGSQGSRTLNRAAEESWTLWKNRFTRLLHQTGAAAYQELGPKFHATGLNGRIEPFFTDMPAQFAEADLIVSRAGASAVSEIAAAGKPSILVPLPTSADQHQLRNAEAMQKAGAAKLIVDSEMTGARLVEEAGRLATEPLLLEQMGEAARGFAKPDAARRAAEILEIFLH